MSRRRGVQKLEPYDRDDRAQVHQWLAAKLGPVRMKVPLAVTTQSPAAQQTVSLAIAPNAMEIKMEVKS